MQPADIDLARDILETEEFDADADTDTETTDIGLPPNLCEDVFKVWRGKKMLSLVSFHVKGVYNNVATEPEIRRLRQRQIPETIVRWVQDFCADRRACILVNGFTSEVQDLPQAGLPQGSALALILFLFFNADLVHSAPRNGSSMAFVDD